MPFHFSGHFKRRMIVLSILTGLIIFISTPLTYFILGIDGVSKDADAHSCYLAKRIAAVVQQNPAHWEYEVQKFSKVLNDYTGVSSIKIFNNKNTIVYQESYTNPRFFYIVKRSPIAFNKVTFGYVEVSENAGKVFYFTGVILLIFGVFGLAIGLVLYKYPTKIVTKAEEKTASILERLEKLSYYDNLTKLPNRVMLDKQLINLLEKTKEKGSNLAVLFLDLDHFKEINDSLGHEYGDILLKSVADRLRSSKFSSELIARQGGDEFIVAIPDFISVSELEKRAISIIKSLSHPFEIEGDEYTITTSIGISIFPTDGKDIKTLLKNADYAMYKAKGQGKNKFCLYSSVFNSNLFIS